MFGRKERVFIIKRIKASMKKVISISTKKKIVFVGDTHGDLQASQIVIKKFLKPGYIIVFLGDYVDRGTCSKENLDFLFEMRKKYPKQVYLLAGNHDCYNQIRCYPCNFWHTITQEENERYAKVFAEMPIVFTSGKIIAVHGGIPDLENLQDVERLEAGVDNWMAILWGDFVEEDKDYLETSDSGKALFRPLFPKKKYKTFGAI